jgi:hypothetical protein
LDSKEYHQCISTEDNRFILRTTYAPLSILLSLSRGWSIVFKENGNTTA